MKKILLLFCCIAAFFNAALSAESFALRSEYNVDTKWATAYQVTVKLTNPSSGPTENWISSFTLPGSNALTIHHANGDFSTNGQNVIVKNLPSNGAIPANANVTFSMIINMPQSGKTSIDNLSAVGNGSGDVPDEMLSAPVLNSITADGEGNYTVTWGNVEDATTYSLESDIVENFSKPVVVYQGNEHFAYVSNQPDGTYFYRVRAQNSMDQSPYSNVESVTLGGGGSNTIVSLNAAYNVSTVWASAFQAVVTLTNKTSFPVKGWSATFTLPAGALVSSHVNGGVFTVTNQNVKVTNLPNNETIQPGKSVSFDMIINKLSAGPNQINGLKATGISESDMPIEIPVAPVIALRSNSATSYTVSWNSVENAFSYVLQEDTDSNFSNPKTVVNDDVLSRVFTNKATGTYYYRAFASNSAGDSPLSNSVNITVTNNNPMPPQGVEMSAWYIDWTSWISGPPFIIPSNVNMLNIFVGQLMKDANGKPTMGGFGTFTPELMKAFTLYLSQQNPPIQAKVSIGGSGGMYDRTWDQLNASNISAYAQGMVDFCHSMGLAGVDFDYEAWGSNDQMTLVGRLIKEFKLLDPNLQTSICSNAGFGPYFPWPAAMKVILDAAQISPGNSAIDMFYIMSYYDPMESEIGWIVGPDGNGGWAEWLKTNYGFTRKRISVGIDDFDAHAYDPDVFRAWALNAGFSVSHWAFDPARPK